MGQFGLFSVSFGIFGGPSKKWTVLTIESERWFIKLMTLIWTKFKLDVIVRGESRRSLKWRNVKLTVQFDIWPSTFSSLDYPGSTLWISNSEPSNETIFRCGERSVYLTVQPWIWPSNFSRSSFESIRRATLTHDRTLLPLPKIKHFMTLHFQTIIRLSV